MSLQEFNSLFQNKYFKDTDNLFEAVNCYAEDAKKLASKYQDRLSKSEALNSVLDNKLPDNLDARKLVNLSDINYQNKYIKQVLCCIDDSNIQISVIKSINMSRYSKSLKYDYTDDLTDCEKSRVRVICNIIWDNLKLMERS